MPPRATVLIVIFIAKKVLGMMEGIDPRLTANRRSTRQPRTRRPFVLAGEIWFNPNIAHQH
jgi:hypothetical protein